MEVHVDDTLADTNENVERHLRDSFTMTTWKYMTKNILLKRKVKRLQNELNRLKKKTNLSSGKTNVLKNIFRADQIRALGRKSNAGYTWSEETVKHALKLRFSCGKRGYSHLLKSGYPLPSLRTLSERVQKFCKCEQSAVNVDAGKAMCLDKICLASNVE